MFVCFIFFVFLAIDPVEQDFEIINGPFIRVFMRELRDTAVVFVPSFDLLLRQVKRGACLIDNLIKVFQTRSVDISERKTNLLAPNLAFLGLVKAQDEVLCRDSREPLGYVNQGARASLDYGGHDFPACLGLAVG